MKITNALPAGTVVKLKESEKKVIIAGILQRAEVKGKTTFFDYVGNPYPEGFLGIEGSVLFQETDIESVIFMGYSDIERQSMIAAIAERLEKETKSL